MVSISKLFRQKTGYRYIDYLTQLRMEKARVLLEHTDLPIKEIVTAVGYYDAAGFRKKFKAIYGINASEHRKQSEEKEDSD